MSAGISLQRLQKFPVIFLLSGTFLEVANPLLLILMISFSRFLRDVDFFVGSYRPLKVMGLGLDVVQCGKTLKAYAQRSAWTSAVELLFHLEVCFSSSVVGLDS